MSPSEWRRMVRGLLGAGNVWLFDRHGDLWWTDNYAVAGWPAHVPLPEGATVGGVHQLEVRIAGTRLVPADRRRFSSGSLFTGYVDQQEKAAQRGDRLHQTDTSTNRMNGRRLVMLEADQGRPSFVDARMWPLLDGHDLRRHRSEPGSPVIALDADGACVAIVGPVAPWAANRDTPAETGVAS